MYEIIHGASVSSTSIIHETSQCVISILFRTVRLLLEYQEKVTYIRITLRTTHQFAGSDIWNTHLDSIQNCCRHKVYSSVHFNIKYQNDHGKQAYSWRCALRTEQNVTHNRVSTGKVRFADRCNRIFGSIILGEITQVGRLKSICFIQNNCIFKL